MNKKSPSVYHRDFYMGDEKNYKHGKKYRQDGKEETET